MIRVPCRPGDLNATKSREEAGDNWASPLAAGHNACRVSSQIQFTSQVLPASAEKACSM
jgi:hypothetical protein